MPSTSGPICCLLGACCPPNAQRQALTDTMVEGGMGTQAAENAATILAPKLRRAHRASAAATAAKLKKAKVK